MADRAELTPDAVRAWVGDFEVGKGRPYAEGPAITGETRHGPTLTAYAKGHRARPYRVTARVEGGAVTAAGCTCPVGGNGRCKHVAGVLLAFATDPGRFAPVGDLDADLAGRGRDELAALVKLLLDRTPQLAPLLAVPLPGFVRGPVSAGLLRRQAEEAIRSAGLHDDWVDEEIAANLFPVLELGHRYQVAGDRPAAEAVFDGVAAAIRAAGLGVERTRDLAGRLHPLAADEVAKRLDLPPDPDADATPF